ncbi:hypothetical protein D8Y20_12105 [Mariprofundus sp. EBB-1]|nr:hypothetical protein D8Y20_12105 [Mariprofundus sp. EBB-1]
MVLLAVGVALYLLFSAPDYGDINADGLNLGKTAYQEGDYHNAAKWFRLAAKKGDKEAQYLFAMLYRDGKGVQRDDVEAVVHLKLSAKQKFAQAQYQLANMLEYGRGVPAADLKAAFGWYKKAAENGLTAAELRMAVMYSEGRGVKKSDADALLWAIQAANSHSIEATSYLQRLLNKVSAKASAGDSSAQFVLARIYQQGQGLNADMEKAEQWLHQSASSGNAKAQFHLAELLLHSSKPEAIQHVAGWYAKAAEQENMPAAARLGVLYALGEGVELNRDEALKWLQKAAESGLPSPQSNLGIMYAEAGNDALAASWLEKAAEQGDKVAQNNLAVMYALGRGVKLDLKSTVKWFKAAAENDDALAQYNLALMYIRGIGLMQNEDVALELLKKAQTAAGFEAKLLLGMMYDLGHGIVTSSSDAEAWYQQASELGSEDALYNLAALYYRQLKYKKAFDLFVQAAEKGDVEAQNTIASMYQNGQGVDVNIEQSIHWYALAAKHAYAPAQFNLGNIYRKGDGVEQQDDKAVQWYREAARQGFAEAQNALAYMYALGRGVSIDRAKSDHWFSKAAKQGLRIAEQNISVLRQNKSGFTLTSGAIDIQLRLEILEEKPLNLANRLQTYHIAQLNK